MSLQGKTVLVTGGGVRLGRAICLALAEAGANLVIHYGSSAQAAEEVQAEARSKGVQAHLLQADLDDAEQTAGLVAESLQYGPLFALINNAAIFEDLELIDTDLLAWERHIRINLTAPFLLSRSFARSLSPGQPGRIINMLDWRAFRPGADHFPYTISKAGLAALTRSLALALAPDVAVNGIALGAILPPGDNTDLDGIIENVPAGRWAKLDELFRTVLFLLDGPSYITGEVIHLDGGRHLV